MPFYRAACHEPFIGFLDCLCHGSRPVTEFTNRFAAIDYLPTLKQANRAWRQKLPPAGRQKPVGKFTDLRQAKHQYWRHAQWGPGLSCYATVDVEQRIDAHVLSAEYVLVSGA